MFFKRKSSDEQHETAWVALRYPDFRAMYGAQFISAIGSWMQLAAVNWHVYILTRDPIALGLVGLVRIGPIIVLSLLGGVMADAMDRRRLLLWTQMIMALCAGTLAFITMTGGESLALIYLFTAIMSGASAFDKPAWSALLPNLVPSQQLGNAVRLNVVSNQLTSVLGPVIAGLLLGATNAGIAYLFNALSFLPVIWFLAQIVLPPLKNENRTPVSFASMFEGLRFIRRTPILWASMWMDFFATLFSSAMALLPIYAADILRVSAFGYGILYAAPSIGSAIGALIMAQIGTRLKQPGAVMLWAVAAYGVATIVFGLSTTFALALAALAVVGFSDAISMVIRNAMRQLLTPDRLRGRMVSVNMIFFMGGPQLGELEAGVLASLFGPVFSVVSGGIATLIAVAAIAASSPVLRQYEEIIPSEEEDKEADSAPATA